MAATFGLAGVNGPTLFGFLLLFGWLLTFLLGILQRIMPFLASMHATRPKGQMPRPVSELSAAQPLKLLAGCHLAALVLLSAAILIESIPLAQLGAAIGLLGALAFAWFTGDLLLRTIGWR
jgi:CBS-domain-containing membrane protein